VSNRHRRGHGPSQLGQVVLVVAAYYLVPVLEPAEDSRLWLRSGGALALFVLAVWWIGREVVRETRAGPLKVIAEAFSATAQLVGSSARVVIGSGGHEVQRDPGAGSVEDPVHVLLAPIDRAGRRQRLSRRPGPARRPRPPPR
jgi:hypothetical protein